MPAGDVKIFLSLPQSIQVQLTFVFLIYVLIGKAKRHLAILVSKTVSFSSEKPKKKRMSLVE